MRRIQALVESSVDRLLELGKTPKHKKIDPNTVMLSSGEFKVNLKTGQVEI